MHAVWDLKSSHSKLLPTSIFDCFIAEQLLSEGTYTISQEEAMERHRVTTLENLAQKQIQLLNTRPSLNRLYYEIEHPLTYILHDMEEKGIMIYQKELTSLGEEIEKERKEKEQAILHALGTEINLASPAQVGSTLVAKLGVPLKKTASGQYATSEKELLPLIPQYPIIKDILRLRELSKLTSTYISPLISKIGEDGRIHTTYHQIGAITGRLSSSDPNMQNIPSSTPIGKRIKSCFHAPEGSWLLSLDYSQQELRILAHLSEEQGLIDAFTKGNDIHISTAAKLFQKKEQAVTQDERMAAKTINFGMIYGMSSFGLSRSLSIPVEQAQLFIDTFYETFPRIKVYFDTYIEIAKKQGYAETMFGRRRYVFSDSKKKFIDPSTYRELINFPIQGSAADLMKAAMVSIHTHILKKRKDTSLLLQIHDELVFEIHASKSDTEKIAHDIADLMRSIYPLRVPLDTSVMIGKRWEK